jgi:hypothetical protein
MFSNAFLLLLAFLQVGFHALTAAGRSSDGPIVSLDYATLEGTSVDAVDKFLGIPYAKPPVGNLRFRRPLPLLPLSGTTLVSDFAPPCDPPHGSVTSAVALVVRRLQPGETVVRNRPPPRPKLRASTTQHWPDSPQL